MSIELEILQYSYWEHFKAAKDLSFILHIEHPKRVELQNTINSLIVEIKNVQPIEKRMCGVGRGNGVVRKRLGEEMELALQKLIRVPNVAKIFVRRQAIFLPNLMLNAVFVCQTRHKKNKNMNKKVLDVCCVLRMVKNSNSNKPELFLSF